MKRRTIQQGFTLIESVVAIVMIAFAVLILSRFLLPAVTQSAAPYYQTRAVALANAVMSEIVARQFDHHSDPHSIERCDPNVSQCTDPSRLGWEAGEEGKPILFNDVDDYLADQIARGKSCWGDVAMCAPLPSQGTIDQLLPGDHHHYANFAVTIAVYYDASFDGQAEATQGNHKRIDVTVMTAAHGSYGVSAYRSNY
ncbi:type IV pilus modification PilV family protein [Thaumasiovibrio sp. DFM-14]|uniref:type IV pilus modification PilV family protein n=1 Tax=Thaumasiovibrio sp. DFM-14 TaxID=3384792 RepID=UPI00399F8E8C